MTLLQAPARTIAATRPAAGGAGGARTLRELDWLMLAAFLLCCIGLVMAVSIQGPRSGPLRAIEAQGCKLLIGLVAFLVAALVPIVWLRRVALPMFLLSTGLCYLAVLLGRGAKGAHRWIGIGGVSFQPVDLARFWLLVACAAAVAAAGAEVVRFRRGFLPTMGAAGLLAGGLLLQPDMGNALFCLALGAVVALCAGVHKRWFLLLGLPALLGIVVLALSRGYVVERLTGFMQAPKPGTQVAQGLVAMSSGGLFGQGLGSGWMKMGFVPEAGNDFVLAVIGEELGLCGCLLVLSLYVLIGWVGFRLVCRIREPFQRYLVLGLTLAICMQAAINLMVVTGLAPAKGIDLPFLSSGGTNLVFSLAAVGVIGNAARAPAGAARVIGR